MCLGAIYWARPERFYFACSREDAAYGFEDAFIYDELQRQPEERAISGQRLISAERLLPFEQWKWSQAKVSY
jgi:guanine deaminase